jgi:hypothetical protein
MLERGVDGNSPEFAADVFTLRTSKCSPRAACKLNSKSHRVRSAPRGPPPPTPKSEKAAVSHHTTCTPVNPNGPTCSASFIRKNLNTAFESHSLCILSENRHSKPSPGGRPVPFKAAKNEVESDASFTQCAIETVTRSSTDQFETEKTRFECYKSFIPLAQ